MVSNSGGATACRRCNARRVDEDRLHAGCLRPAPGARGRWLVVPLRSAARHRPASRAAPAPSIFPEFFFRCGSIGELVAEKRFDHRGVQQPILGRQQGLQSLKTSRCPAPLPTLPSTILPLTRLQRRQQFFDRQLLQILRVEPLQLPGRTQRLSGSRLQPKTFPPLFRPQKFLIWPAVDHQQARKFRNASGRNPSARTC